MSSWRIFLWNFVGFRQAFFNTNRVSDAGHDDAENDVTIEVAALGNGARYNGGARGSKCALKKNIVGCFKYICKRIKSYLKEQFCIVFG